MLLEGAKCWHFPQCLGIPIALLSVTIILCWDVLERHVGLLRAGQNQSPLWHVAFGAATEKGSAGWGPSPTT